jgi:threonine dehydrogenase-like Zn-dependent dehydrogenase
MTTVLHNHEETAMRTMPALMLTAPGKAEWVDTPEPTLTGPDDALVRPIAVASCDLDTVVNAGTFALPLPYALGHEFVGEVTAVGDGVTTVAPGDRVVVPFQISCGACRPCRRGQTAYCATVRRGASYGLGVIGGDQWGGAMAELVRVPYADAMLLPLPVGLDPAAVASLDNMPDAWRTVAPHLTGLAADERRVLIVGSQSIGLYATAFARALGADVTYVDDDDRRNGIADRLGATLTLAGADRFPITVSTAGDPVKLRQALRATAPGGVCTEVGVFTGDVTLPLNQMYTKGVRLIAERHNARADLPAVLDLIAQGRMDPAIVTGTTAGWDEAAAAWSDHRDKLVVVR